jgi:hypothetical protein
VQRNSVAPSAAQRKRSENGGPDDQIGDPGLVLDRDEHDAIGAARTFGPGVVSSRKCKLPDPISADTEDQDREWRAGAVGSPAHEGRTAVSDNRDFTCGRLSDDSAVEQRGFEPLFPHKNGWRVLTALIDLKALLLRENQANRARGIDGSNLASSSGESGELQPRRSVRAPRGLSVLVPGFRFCAVHKKRFVGAIRPPSYAIPLIVLIRNQPCNIGDRLAIAFPLCLQLSL